jgi:hypothetical protein
MIDDRIARAAQICFVDSIQGTLEEKKAEKQRTGGNEKIHWKDACRMLLFLVAHGDSWPELVKTTGAIYVVIIRCL